MHELKYQLKILLRDRVMVFWAFIFPLLLATMFNLAFSNLITSEGFEAINIAIVELQEDENFKTVIDSLSSEGENQLFRTQYVSLDKAQQLLEGGSISGYLIVSEEIEITVSDRGFSQTMIQAVVNNYYQFSSTMTNIAELNPSAFLSGVFDDMGLDRDNFNEVTNQNVDLTVIYFYSLIGMTCMYGGIWGLLVTTNIEANLSTQGTRVAVAPTRKIKVLISGLLAAFICQYASVLLLVGYLLYGIGISFGSQLGLILLLTAAGSYVGLALGSLIGNTLKGSLDTKINVNMAITMVLSFLSGMMVIEMKYWVQERFPLAAYINPVNLITDGLYALYYYTTNDRYFFNILCLLVIGIIMSAISLIMMRDKKYDSI